MSRMLLDLSVYLITDTAQCGELGVAETVRQAVAAGATTVQLRDPDAALQELEVMGRELAAVLAPTGVPLIVNDYPQLVPRIGAAGLHIGQGDIDPVRARELIGPDAVLGLSVGNLVQLRQALQSGADLDYLGVGPVWTTGSKDDAGPAEGTEVLAQVVRESPWPCVAIGGITAQRVAQVKRAGAAGISVISAICGQPDVGAATRQLADLWEQS